ncbi:hypothetical protein AQJ30_15685 [Streptomyces longwoodensis]|uniref:Uncharacterized protein n=1 Tax=Streptomyces longwoodensis TaxID=68231 RepID=A0A124HR87_9ACTN|nr:hypothetical protein [Streptomyces longwoodensis]KUN37724.1 hypothetical protein AQJ30_15685 [Streptomyces longwoodensis]
MSSNLIRAAEQLGQIIEAVDTARAQADAIKPPKVWRFASSADARTAVDRDQAADGDILVVESEQVVAFVVVVMPVAITEQHGAFHPYSNLGKPARDYSEGYWTRSVDLAEQTAIELGYALADPAAAETARTAAGLPVPVETPRMLVEAGDILRHFGARLHVIDTGVRILPEADSAEWWALVEGVSEDDRRRTYRGRWTFTVPVATAAWDIVIVERTL